jgi:hypothetical protein
MIDFGTYLVRASLSMSLLYCVYWFFLKKETLFRVNRIYLISALVISMIIPMITLHYSTSLPAVYSSDLIHANLFEESSGSTAGSLSGLSSAALIVYLTGVAIFLFRILWQFILLAAIIFKSESKWNDGTRVIENDKFLLPFSFMNIIFINPKYIRETEIDDIIAHEKVHIRENHWFDLFIVELITIFMWFNPFIWLYERSIKQNHEYLADNGVIAQGYSVGRYHSVLINQLLGMEVIGITNNLNYSLNAKRLKMMKKKKTPKTRALHILWSLPVIILLLAAFAQPEYEKNDNNKIVSVKKLVKLTCGVFDVNGDPITGAIASIKGSDKGTKTDKNGFFTLDVASSDIVVVELKGYETSVIHMEKLAAKEGKLDAYKLKIKMKAEGSSEKVKYDPSSEAKELELMLKKLTIRKDELDKMKQKISQAEKEGSVPEEELAKKKASIKEEYLAVIEKTAKVKEKLKGLQK